mmetsp:Transcript_33539/g.74228  ORF Transcript_33539/g.74228 Transcript_33539/m.74228 type:complete len:272 (-) Transcript_33539:1421-2236(-)
MISSLTALAPRNFFMLFQLVSSWPSTMSTPSKTSLMASGGILKLRISSMFSFLIWPTALRAWSIRGCTPASSASTPPRRCFSSSSSTACRFLSTSTSLRRSAACIMEAWMRCSASSASACLTCSSLRCLSAFLLRVSTVVSASDSLDRPPLRKFCCWRTCLRFSLKMRQYRLTKAMYCLVLASVPIMACICTMWLMMFLSKASLVERRSWLLLRSSCMRVKGMCAMALVLQTSSHCMEQRVKRAGLDSQRARKSSLEGSMLTTMCKLRWTL